MIKRQLENLTRYSRKHIPHTHHTLIKAKHSSLSSMSEFQPLHRQPVQGLQKKMFQRNMGVVQGQAGAIASPTDNLMSPCSQKLNAHKNRFFANSKATKLNFQNVDDK